MKYLILVKDLYIQELFVQVIPFFGDEIIEHYEQKPDAAFFEHGCFIPRELKEHVKPLREVNSSCLVSLLTHEFFSPVLFGSLKEEFSVDYVLPIDINEAELYGFFRALRYTEDETQLEYRPFQEHMERYKDNAFTKLIEMFKLVTSLETAFDLDKVGELRMAAHKIAGSGAAFDFKFLGDVCHQLDLFLTPHLEPKLKAPEPDFIPVCHRYLRMALFAYQKIEVVDLPQRLYTNS